MVAAAGPLSNILIALIFGILIRSEIFNDSNVFLVFALIVQVNLVLAIFNLVPIPPLDGSKILFAFLPPKYLQIRTMLEQYGFLMVLIFIFFFWGLITPIFSILFRLFTGLDFI
jgi:Zn-dependent protease